MKKVITIVTSSVLILTLILVYPKMTFAAITRVNSMSTTLAAATSNMVALGFTAAAGDTIVVIEVIRSATATCTISAQSTSFTAVYSVAASSGNSTQCLAY